VNLEGFLLAAWTVGVFIAGAVFHARVWAGRLMPRYKVPTPPAPRQTPLAAPDEEKELAEQAAWILPKSFTREDYLNPSGTKQFDPKQLRGRGNAFQT